MSGESTFVLDSTVSPARSFALSFDPGAFDTLMDTQTLLKETFGQAMPEARGSPHAEEERQADPPAAVEKEEEEEEDVIVPYERERLERMRRHDEVMRRLGITESVNKLAGKAAPPPEKNPEKNPVIIIDDDEADEAKSDTEDEDEEEEEDDDDETGGIYGCNRCRFSTKGCYDTPDGKVKGCHPDAHLGPLYLQGLPKRASVPVDAPKKRRKVVYEHEVPPIFSPRTKRPRLVPEKFKAPKTDRTCTVVPSPKHTSSHNDKKKVTARWLSKLDVPELNETSTVIPGLQGIHFMTADGRFMMAFRTPSSGSLYSQADSLDEAVKAYNKARSKCERSTHKITAEHRAVVKEMQRKRELIVAKKAKPRKKLAKQKPAPATTRHRPRPEPAAKKAAPPRAKTPPRFALVPQESAPTSVPKPTEGAAAAAPVTPPPRVDSRISRSSLAEAEISKRLKDQVNELQDMNRSLLDIAQRAMSMAAKNAQTMG